MALRDYLVRNDTVPRYRFSMFVYSYEAVEVEAGLGAGGVVADAGVEEGCNFLAVVELAEDFSRLGIAKVALEEP